VIYKKNWTLSAFSGRLRNEVVTMPVNSFFYTSGEGRSPSSAHYDQRVFLAEPLLDSIQASAILLIHPKTLQRMARRGQMPAVRVGKLWRFRRTDINNWIAKQVPAA
jgi:excisionase family DNA binding protein